MAKTDGVKFCINPDTHAVNELSNVALGVNIARKARLSRARRGQHRLSRRRENDASPYTNISPGKALAMLIEGRPYR
jgi:hypothetical protein